LKLRIGGVQDTSTVDWRSHVVSLIYTAGCNFRCPFCHNSSLLPINSGTEVDLPKLLERLKADMLLADSVGFTGGEPCLQPEAVTEVFKWCRKVGAKTFLNTNGSRPSCIEALAEEHLLDYVAFDVKAPLRPEVYSRVIGVSFGVEEIVENVTETIRICSRRNLPFEVRTTIVPSLMDDEASVREIARAIRGAPAYVLQQFSPSETVLNEQLRSTPSPKREHLLALAHAAIDEGLEKVYISTRRHGLERVT